LAGAFGKNIYGLKNIGMNDTFQLIQRIFVCKYQMPKLAAVDLSILAEQPRTELIQYGLIAGRSFGNDTMGKRVGIDRIRAKMFQHAPYHAFAGRDVTR
jgi:hypothetical protein